MFDTFLDGYEYILHAFAEITVHTLEFIGIAIIVFGSIRVLIKVIKSLIHKTFEQQSVVVELGKALALALEFKMGAEIVNTVIVRDLRELAVLAIVIALRAVLAVLIHWEIKNDEPDYNLFKGKKDKKDEE